LTASFCEKYLNRDDTERQNPPSAIKNTGMRRACPLSFLSQNLSCRTPPYFSREMPQGSNALTRFYQQPA
jgi:hypothetical protein